MSINTKASALNPFLNIGKYSISCITALRYSLAFVWIATALFSFLLVDRELIIDLFLSAGIAHDTHLQTLLFYSATLLDFILGFTFLINYRISLFGKIQIALTAFYTIFLGLSDPQWFFHPYGPLIKNIPLMVATYIVVRAER